MKSSELYCPAFEDPPFAIDEDHLGTDQSKASRSVTTHRQFSAVFDHHVPPNPPDKIYF
jgi:hypothetical protein